MLNIMSIETAISSTIRHKHDAGGY
jgi:hypothetical protein